MDLEIQQMIIANVSLDLCGIILTLVPVCALENMKEMFDRLQRYFSEEFHEKMVMFLVDKEALKAISPDRDRYEVIPDTDSFDYIYDGEKMRTYSGRKYHQKKNFVNGFVKEYGERAEYVKLHKENKEEILTYLKKWVEEKPSEDEFNRIDSEERGIAHIIDYEEEAGISMGGIRIDGKLEAFSLGSFEKDKSMAVIHVEKANPAIRGLYPYLAMKFLKQEYPGAAWINREDDMGFEALRRSKESYHPVFRAEKYTIVER